MWRTHRYFFRIKAINPAKGSSFGLAGLLSVGESMESSGRDADDEKVLSIIVYGPWRLKPRLKNIKRAERE
jgi:hypothetical protein